MKYSRKTITSLICLFLSLVDASQGAKLQRFNDPLNSSQDIIEDSPNYRKDLSVNKRWVDVDDEEDSIAPTSIKHSDGGKDSADFTKIVESFNNGLTNKLGALSDVDRITADQLGEQDDKYIKAAEDASKRLPGSHFIAGKASDLERFSSDIDPEVHRRIQAALAQDGNSPEELQEVNTALAHGLPPPEIVESTNHALHSPLHQESIAMQPQEVITHSKPIHKYIGQIIHKYRPSEHRYIPMKHIFLKHVPQILKKLRMRPPYRVVHRPRIIIVKEPHQHFHQYCKYHFVDFYCNKFC